MMHTAEACPPIALVSPRPTRHTPARLCVRQRCRVPWTRERDSIRTGVSGVGERDAARASAHACAPPSGRPHWQCMPVRPGGGCGRRKGCILYWSQQIGRLNKMATEYLRTITDLCRDSVSVWPLVRAGTPMGVPGHGATRCTRTCPRSRATSAAATTTSLRARARPFCQRAWPRHTRRACRPRRPTARARR